MYFRLQGLFPGWGSLAAYLGGGEKGSGRAVGRRTRVVSAWTLASEVFAQIWAEWAAPPGRLTGASVVREERMGRLAGTLRGYPSFALANVSVNL